MIKAAKSRACLLSPSELYRLSSLGLLISGPWVGAPHWAKLFSTKFTQFQKILSCSPDKFEWFSDLPTFALDHCHPLCNSIVWNRCESKRLTEQKTNVIIYCAQLVLMPSFSLLKLKVFNDATILLLSVDSKQDEANGRQLWRRPSEGVFSKLRAGQ